MFWKIIGRQMAQKWSMTLLLFLVVSILVSLFVFITNTNSFAVRSMQLIMKNMGLNQVLMPAGENPLHVYLCTDGQQLFPEAVLEKLAGNTELLSKYYVGMLQQRMQIGDGEVILTGIRPVKRPDETLEKSSMVNPVPPAHARLGRTAAAQLNLRAGDPFTLGSASYAVDKILPERGTLDDCRVYLPLPAVQEFLGTGRQINAVQSFECLHVGGPLEDIHAYQQGLLNDVLPGYRQYNVTSIAQGRYYARRMTEKYLYYIGGAIMLIAAMVIAISGFQEVTERKYETGVLISMGAGYGYITGLYLVKIVLISALAAVVGFWIGGSLSVRLTAPFLMAQTQHIVILWENLPNTVFMSCGVAVLAQLLPIIKLLRLDPCAILTEE
jgi:hypothetical protein